MKRPSKPTNLQAVVLAALIPAIAAVIVAFISRGSPPNPPAFVAHRRVLLQDGGEIIDKPLIVIGRDGFERGTPNGEFFAPALPVTANYEVFETKASGQKGRHLGTIHVPVDGGEDVLVVETSVQSKFWTPESERTTAAVMED
ncbi:MAG: hypothetical protein J0M04_17700 [Verrucomicrobia bacterium]|nr:hypothetical protein [Verrucomicrobiota bacterium]